MILHFISGICRRILPPAIFDKLVQLFYYGQRLARPLRRVVPKMINTRGYKILYYPDNLWTYAGNSFDSDPRFIAAWARIHEHVGNIRRIDWRLHIVLALAEYCSHLEGDFVECGTFRGINAHAILGFLDFKSLNKKFYLFDTWTGLSEQRLHSFEKDRAVRRYDDCYAEVKATFADTPDVILIQGLVPDTLSQVAWNKVCFLHLDMNCVLPEEAAAEFFWDKIVPGGVIISDDYSHPGYEAQKAAFEKFARSKGAMVLSLPTGTGVIFKR